MYPSIHYFPHSFIHSLIYDTFIEDLLCVLIIVLGASITKINKMLSLSLECSQVREIIIMECDKCQEKEMKLTKGSMAPQSGGTYHSSGYQRRLPGGSNAGVKC